MTKWNIKTESEIATIVYSVKTKWNTKIENEIATNLLWKQNQNEVLKLKVRLQLISSIFQKQNLMKKWKWNCNKTKWNT